MTTDQTVSELLATGEDALAEAGFLERALGEAEAAADER